MGTFTLVASPATGGSPRSLAVGDFNGDGRQDLATANFNANSVSVLLGNGTGSTGDGTFTADFAPSTGRAPVSVAVGDFSGDARPDLAVAAVNASQVFVLPNESAAAVAAPGSVLISEVRLAGVNERAISSSICITAPPTRSMLVAGRSSGRRVRVRGLPRVR